MALLTWVNSSIEEGLEIFFKGLFPEEFLVAILVNEVFSGSLNVFEVVEDNLHGSKELELIFDFNQVVASAGVETSDLNGN